MGLRIRTNVASLVAQRRLGLTTDSLAESMGKLSSGQRINKSADDAAGLAISESLRGKIRSLEQAKRNANDAVSMVQVAEGGMNEVSNILIRLKELATQAASDNIGNVERSFTNKEYVELVDEIQRIANSTEFNGHKVLLGGDGNNDVSEFVFHIGSGDGTVPNVDQINISIDDIKIDAAEGFGLGNESEVGPAEQGDDFARETAAEKLSILESAISSLADKRATLGAKQNRLSSSINNLGIQIENMSAANSRIRDVDFASETANYTQMRILQQGGASVLSQANQIPEVALSLLR
ncbi:MAG: flagellin [Oligoflexales bacterium]|nr:flagellin [Oligoflexales bacterium]